MQRILAISLLFLLLCSTHQTVAKTGDVRIQIVKTKVALNEAFQLKIIVENEYIKSYSDFPEIKGFQKRGTSSSTNTSIVNGKMSVETSVTQNYLPTKEGQFNLAAFQMQVNGKNAKSNGANILVGPPRQARQRRDPFAWDPFEEFFGDGRKEVEYVDVEANAFFSITTDKTEVYKGEGFNLTVSFFVAENNRAQMRFPGDIGMQLNEIVKKIKPSNVWEENFGISEIVRKPVKIKGKNYDQYILFQSSYFPLNEDDIQIPNATLNVIKYKEAKTRSFFGAQRQESNAKFVSKAKRIKVKPLPDHPLKELVSVGNYRLSESTNKTSVETGNSFEYVFTVEGIGNISGIQPMPTPQDENFDFYSPNIGQNIQRTNNKVRGSKTFSYFGIPKEPGSYKLNDYFSWTYFNPSTEKYEELSSDIILDVSGESQKNSYILSNDMGSFYELMEYKDNTLRPIEQSIIPRIIYMTILSITMIVSVYLYFRK